MDMNHSIITDDGSDPLKGYLLRAEVHGGEGVTLHVTDGHPWANPAEREVMRMLTPREVVMLAKWLLEVAEFAIDADAAAAAAREV